MYEAHEKILYSKVEGGLCYLLVHGNHKDFTNHRPAKSLAHDGSILHWISPKTARTNVNVIVKVFNFLKFLVYLDLSWSILLHLQVLTYKSFHITKKLTNGIP